MIKAKKVTLNNIAKSIDDLANFTKKELKKTNGSIDDLANFTKKELKKTNGSIDDLAKATKKGFDKVDEKFDKVDEKFDKVDEKFDKLTGTVVTIKEEHKNFKNTMDEIGKNVKKILNSVDGIAGKHQDFEAELAADHEAHDRIQKDINEIRTHVNLKVKHPILKPEKT